MNYSLLIIDDEESIRDSLSMALGRHYTVSALASGKEALEALPALAPDLVLLDIGLPDISGLEVLDHIRGQAPHAAVIMITAFEDLDTVISAMKRGAFDYLLKPLRMDALKLCLDRAGSSIRLGKEIRLLQDKALREQIPFFVAESEALTDVVQTVAKVAVSPDTPVLVEGDTGTGKELIASAIHYRSPNFRGPLVTVNCAAIPAELIESELFGYAPGAFSGAGKRGKTGLVEEAAGGTLFLDEIGELPGSAQAKLLRFLQEGEFYALGSTAKRTVRTRVVAATNRDLEDMVRTGTFRQDLFYRLAVVRIRVPSLARRKEDILPLARLFLHQYGEKFGKKFNDLTQNARNALLGHSWTGNVRELRNIMERATLMACGPDLDAGDLGLAKECAPVAENRAALTREGVNLPSLLHDLERGYYEQALALAEGNESQAARLLGVSRDTFRYRRGKLGV
ncbi:DNA-binding transcriptional response regulator, NtrC family, contains REC, AAA-type ATPase, and a Fis-type DNA-binding domains [Desulfomicrobium apsheronum]|uniref:DNA-binding transcriptional response regulator, NtrC family, contains REC, AAA-type ATPase, and a Fis-type DNA-binding domains n=1 Tax=Desulfomicrobium apsheronum TaxID=52560 RepID=A0A1I3ZMP5_9BACT|nr:sigma-54 dependent transcriptional regulator [Desulfomicrobium apsheronum]SFK44819.1 DNA-binding transcriptional response regulator, NtrC family, contains REC, AAA-type ATPase, and a Fis-type DNA-binding domains [Desulfomicrobium apsheronum]